MSTPYRRNAKTPAGRIAATPSTANWGGFFGLLQEYAGAAAGYSLRRIGSGPVVRLRRASDNEEKDFYAGEVVAGTAGAEYIPNTDFSTTDDWVLGSAGWSITGGQLVFDGSVSGFATPTNLNGSYVDGDYYILSFDIVSQTGTNNRINLFGVNRTYSVLQIPTSGAQSISLVVRYGGVGGLGFYSSAGDTVTYDNFSVKPYTPSTAELWAFENYGGIYARQTTDSAYATTWYDQSGSGNDATQATAASQPLLIRAGVTNTVNGKAALSFDGTDDYLDFSSNITTTRYSNFAVAAESASGNNPIIGLSGGQLIGIWSDNKVYENNGTDFIGVSITRSSSQRLYDVIKSGDTGGDFSLNINGSDQGAYTGTAWTSVTMENIGFRTTTLVTLVARYDGSLQELIIYASDQSANRVGIETNINDHYGIY